MIEAGFEDVHVKVHKVQSPSCERKKKNRLIGLKIPWGPWAKDPRLKEIGRYQYVNAIQSVDSYGLALMTRFMGYTEDQAKIFLAIVKNQLKSKSLHAYNLMYLFPFPYPLFWARC
jgi:hypothetical protein